MYTCVIIFVKTDKAQAVILWQIQICTVEAKTDISVPKRVLNFS